MVGSNGKNAWLRRKIMPSRGNKKLLNPRNSLSSSTKFVPWDCWEIFFSRSFRITLWKSKFSFSFRKMLLFTLQRCHATLGKDIQPKRKWRKIIDFSFSPPPLLRAWNFNGFSQKFSLFFDQQRKRNFSGILN